MVAGSDGCAAVVLWRQQKRPRLALRRQQLSQYPLGVRVVLKACPSSWILTRFPSLTASLRPCTNTSQRSALQRPSTLQMASLSTRFSFNPTTIARHRARSHAGGSACAQCFLSKCAASIIHLPQMHLPQSMPEPCHRCRNMHIGARVWNVSRGNCGSSWFIAGENE